MSRPLPYQRRVVDEEIDELLPALSAVALEGPKGVGKTRTALQRVKTAHELDDPAVLEVAKADPARLLEGQAPVLIDEWQRLPEVWDLVRRAVDRGAAPGTFLLTGSAAPSQPATHSGAARIVTVRMRPLSMHERLGGTTVSLVELLSGSRPDVAGTTDVGLDDYADEILRSGFPGLRDLSGRPLRALLDGYLDRVVDRDIADDAGVTIRNPAALRRWMAAYAAATSTEASFEKLRDAASAGYDQPPSKKATQAYRDALARLWVLDEVPAWAPTTSRLNELAQKPKHHLADPALAARLLGAQSDTLLQPLDSDVAKGGPLVGALFESLVTLSVRVYAAHSEASVGHLRTQRGRQEVDLIVARPDGKVVAIEIKLARLADRDDAKHLRWLEQHLGDRVLDQVIITTGPAAYRRDDGIAVVPLALLGP